MTQVVGQQDTSTADNEYNTMVFVFRMLLQKMQTATLVRVISCTNDGGVSPVGKVTVQPLVNQMTGQRQAVEHGQIFNCLYSRLAGGLNAVILDPEPGDIGLMAFCSRDISGVVANIGPAPPGSFRMFDWADGVYAGCVPLGVTPTQYVQILPGGAGVKVVSPTKITLQAPMVEIDASTQLTVNSPASEFSGTIHTPETITGDTDVIADGISGAHHGHEPGSYEAGSTPVTGTAGAPT